MAKHFYGWMVFGFLLSACGGTDDQRSQGNDEAVSSPSSSRVQPKGQVLQVIDNSAEVEVTSRMKRPRFKYLASIEAPMGPSGDGLQATSFDSHKDSAVVTYAQAGEIVEGAIDLLRIDEESWVTVEQTLLFKNTEFADVKIREGRAYLVGAESGAREGAVLVVVDLLDPREAREIARVPLPGFYAVHIFIEKNRALIASGDNAGIVTVDLDTLEIEEVKEVSNVLSVLRIDSEIYWLHGEKETLISSLSPTESSARLASEPSEAPSRMVLHKKYIVTNAGVSGLSIFDTHAQRLRSQVELMGTGNGLDVADRYAYLAQGEAGLLLVDLHNVERPYVMGQFDFPDDRGSANHVRFGVVNKAEILFLADGLGGLRVIEIDA